MDNEHLTNGSCDPVLQTEQIDWSTESCGNSYLFKEFYGTNLGMTATFDSIQFTMDSTNMTFDKG